MQQRAVVKKLLPNNMAEIEVQRQGACSHDCSKCGGCSTTDVRVSAQAFNGAGAKVGDWVTIEGETKRVLGLAAIVYVIPLVLFFVFYAAAAVTFLSSFAGLVGCAGFAAGIAGAVFYNKHMQKKGEITYKIVRHDS